MELVLFVGLQASGKSSYCREQFYRTHVRINLDMLKTRHREAILLDACLSAKQPCVIDNTNPTRDDRKRYIDIAKGQGFRVIGYYFQSSIDACLERNTARPKAEQIPDVGVLATYNRMEVPAFDEGFDELYYVKAGARGGFQVESWADEV